MSVSPFSDVFYNPIGSLKLKIETNERRLRTSLRRLSSWSKILLRTCNEAALGIPDAIGFPKCNSLESFLCLRSSRGLQRAIFFYIFPVFLCVSARPALVIRLGNNAMYDVLTRTVHTRMHRRPEAAKR